MVDYLPVIRATQELKWVDGKRIEGPSSKANIYYAAYRVLQSKGAGGCRGT